MTTDREAVGGAAMGEGHVREIAKVPNHPPGDDEKLLPACRTTWVEPVQAAGAAAYLEIPMPTDLGDTDVVTPSSRDDQRFARQPRWRSSEAASGDATGKSNRFGWPCAWRCSSTRLSDSHSGGR